jgi:hypothetical protein
MMNGMKRRGNGYGEAGIMEAVDNANSGTDKRFDGATTTQTGVGVGSAQTKYTPAKTVTPGQVYDMAKGAVMRLKRRVLGS